MMLTENTADNPIATYQHLVYDGGIHLLYSKFNEDREMLNGYWSDEHRQSYIVIDTDEYGHTIKHHASFSEFVSNNLRLPEELAVGLISEKQLALRHSGEFEAFLQVVLNNLKVLYEYCSDRSNKIWAGAIQTALKRLYGRLRLRFEATVSQGTFFQDDSFDSIPEPTADDVLGYKFLMSSVEPLHRGLITLGLFEEEDVPIANFRAFISGANSGGEPLPIKLKKPLRKAAFILKSLEPLFEDWSIRTLVGLQIFQNDKGRPITEGQLNTNASQFKTEHPDYEGVYAQVDAFLKQFRKTQKLRQS